ncbi:hypothetical protein ACFWIB_33970 [Streptomyces sp. NPDC127051]|uniref:hypothetical protein n=1 Tax=Streptomyces sp. NPDC127051 TaxID=3347119 RepID=UPI003654820A
MTSIDVARHAAFRAGTARLGRGLWPYWLTARLAGVSYLVTAPPRTLLLSVLPRAVLQTVFYALLGRLATGDAGLVHGLTGAIAFLAVGPLIVRLPDIGTEERHFGTMGRLLTGRPPTAALIVARSWPYAAEALGVWAAATLTVPLILGHPELVLDQFTAFPAYVVVMLATASMGFVVTSTCLGRRSEVAISNTLAYATLALGGVLPAAERLGPVRAVADLLPFTPALELYRVRSADGWDTALLVRALLLTAAWTALAWLIARILTTRSLRHGLHELI